MTITTTDRFDPAALTVSTDRDPRGLIVRVAGAASPVAVRTLTDALIPVIAARPARVVVDLTELTAIGSLGMGALISLGRTLAAHGGRLYVAGPSRLVTDSFARARVLDLLNVRPTVEQALGDETPDA